MIIKSIVCREFGGEIQFSNENGAYIIIIINEENFLAKMSKYIDKM